MTDYEDLLRQAAQARGWTIELGQNRISVRGVPYRKKDGEAGTCQVLVETQDDGQTMKAPENGSGASHAAVLIGVSQGHAYQATGEAVGNVLWTDNANQCVISIKRDEGEYVNAWHALFVYTATIAGEVGLEDRDQVERVFKFEIEGEDSREMKAWRNRARGQRVAIVGLGGVGLWILDLMSKTYVKEIRIWDGDVIEGRNLLRAPGWAGQDAIGKNKAQYFGEHYQRMREGISIHAEYWQPDDHSDVLRDLDFVFVAIDKEATRTALCSSLEELGIPFIDVGMGIELRKGQVRGSCQVFFSGEDPGRWRIGIPTVEGAGEEDYYDLQLADMGGLNAALAVGTWRRHIGQYEAEEKDWLIRYLMESSDLIKRTEQR